MTDEEIRALERALDEAGLGDVVRYVSAQRRVTPSPVAPLPEQGPPLWCDLTVPPGGIATGRVDVPYIRSDVPRPGPVQTLGFEVTGLSVLPAARTPHTSLRDLADGGHLRLVHVMTGQMHEFPMRLVMAWPWEPGDPPGGTPVLRLTPVFLHNATGMMAEVRSAADAEVRVKVVLHGRRLGGW